MARIDALIDAQENGFGLFHGTKVSRKTLENEGLRPGNHALPPLRDFVRLVWASLGPAMTPPYDVDKDRDIRDFHGTDVMLSTMLAKGAWRNDGVAFALNRFAAFGYARDGSEALRGATALRDLAANRYPDVLERLRRGEHAQLIESALDIIDAPRETDSVVAVLIKRPETGYFFTINAPHEPIDNLEEDVLGRIPVSELLFSETIPPECFRLEDVPPGAI